MRYCYKATTAVVIASLVLLAGCGTTRKAPAGQGASEPPAGGPEQSEYKVTVTTSRQESAKCPHETVAGKEKQATVQAKQDAAHGAVEKVTSSPCPVEAKVDQQSKKPAGATEKPPKEYRAKRQTKMVGKAHAEYAARREARMKAKAAAGAGEYQLRYDYKVGDTERVRYSSGFLYHIWVEMPGKPATQTTRKDKQETLVLRREVEAIDPNGSALMNVTIEEAQVAINWQAPGNQAEKTVEKHYRSDAKGTQSNWPGMPGLVGATYKIKLAPDGTVEAVMGLQTLYSKLRISDPLGGSVVFMVSEKGIKRQHERQFVRHSPDLVKATDSYEKLAEIPDPMIKALAIKRTYQLEPAEMLQGRQLLPVTMTGEPAHTVPQDFPAPPEITDFWPSTVRQKSDMQELNVHGKGVFDPAAGRVHSETESIECLLVLLGENLGFGGPEAQKQKDQGEMFTKIELHSKFELLE